MSEVNYTSQPAIAPEGPVFSALSITNGKISHIDEALSQLEDAIELALKGKSPVEAKGLPPSVIPATVLVGRIEDINERLGSTLTRINEMVFRVHL